MNGVEREKDDLSSSQKDPYGCGTPMASKEATKRAVAALIEDGRPTVANVFGNGPLLLSNIPRSSMAQNAEVCLGIE